ncbi:MAG: hypothetical protein CR991_02090 [Proteobacteria bacterium]|nr:MAG: hypothetical protein CR991_02090 [Pseudomonadota bacterium]
MRYYVGNDKCLIEETGELYLFQKNTGCAVTQIDLNEIIADTLSEAIPVDPNEHAEFFGVGFSLVAVSFLIGTVLSSILRLIKR